VPHLCLCVLHVGAGYLSARLHEMFAGFSNSPQGNSIDRAAAFMKGTSMLLSRSGLPD